MVVKKTIKPVKKVTTKKKVSAIKLVDLPELPDTPENRKLITTILMNGKISEFWTFLCKQLDYNIEEVKQVILYEDEITDEERNDFRMKLYYQEKLRNLPDELLEQLIPKENKSEGKDLDPYA